MRYGKVFVDGVHVPARMRQPDPDKVKQIADSMAMLGQQQPISIWSPDTDTVELVAGLHRLMAAQHLGWEEIECAFVELDATDREIWEIDENLARAELSPAQVAEHLARRKELWEGRKALGGSSCATQVATDHKDRPQNQKRFAAETADSTGISKASINRATARAAALGDDINEVVGTSLDKGVELDALAKMPESERKEIIARAKAGERVSAKLAADPLNDFEAREKQVARLMSAWNAASPDAREQFLERIDRPVFDNTAAGAPDTDTPAFLRREA